MLTRLLRLWMCWCVALFIALGCSYFGPVFAQGLRGEPRIEGVTYSEMADWQRWYGGGPGLYAHAPGQVPYWYGQPGPPPVFMQPCPPKKAKRGKALKKSDRN